MKGKSVLFHRLKDLRQDSDKSQTEIADVINTSQSYYAQYERGERPLTLERALEIAEYYGVSLDYLAGRTNIKAIAGLTTTKNETTAGETTNIIKHRIK